MISLIFRIILGTIFMVSGLAKIADPIRFMLTLRNFRLFPETIVPFSAIYLPWLEFVLGLSVLIGLLYRTSSLLITFLNLIFFIAILSVIARGIEIDCGCYGLLADMLKIPDNADAKAAIRNLVFIAMGIYIFMAEETVCSLENHLRRI